MAKVAICMAMAMMYTVLLTRLGSNSLYKSTNCSCLQGHRGQGPFMTPAAPPAPLKQDSAGLVTPGQRLHVSLLPPALGGHSLLRAPGLGLAVQVDETHKMHAELQRDREDGV